MIKREEVAVLISGSNEESVLGHYLKHQENHYPQWFPVSLLTDILIDREYESAIDKRILSPIKNCCENDSDAEKYSGRYIIPLEYDFCTEAQLSMDYESKRLRITIWSGDTKWQGYNLFNKTTNDPSWPLDVISKYERNNSTLRGNDKLAGFILRIINQLMNKIK